MYFKKVKSCKSSGQCQSINNFQVIHININTSSQAFLTTICQPKTANCETLLNGFNWSFAPVFFLYDLTTLVAYASKFLRRPIEWSVWIFKGFDDLRKEYLLKIRPLENVRLRVYQFILDETKSRLSARRNSVYHAE